MPPLVDEFEFDFSICLLLACVTTTPAGDPTSSSLIGLFSLSVLLFTSFSPLLLPSPATTCADMGDVLAEGLLNGSDYRWDVNLKLSKILWLMVLAALNFEKLCPCPWHERRKFDLFWEPSTLIGMKTDGQEQ